MVTGLNTKLDELTKNLSDMKSQVNRMETLLDQANARNAELVTAMEAKDLQIEGLIAQLNHLEQHHRSWSIRVHGLQLRENEESDNRAVGRKLFEEVLQPILAGAIENGDLYDMPNADDVIEQAHVLPSKNSRDGQPLPKPIIARFYSRRLRGLIFKHKREFCLRNRAAVLDRPGALGKPLYAIFEDLTKINFNKMRALANHANVAAAWTVAGQIRFKLKDSEAVHRVKSVLDPVEKILNSLSK